MPLHEYSCETCGTAFEVLRPLRADGVEHADVACPEGHTTVRRRLSVFATLSVRGAEPAPAAGAPAACACGGACACAG